MLFCPFFSANTVGLVDCLAKEYPMNETRTNEGGYEASDLRKKLNGEILDRFPADLKALMVPFDNGDFLRIPTEKEIHGENYYGEYESPYVTQWKPMKLRRNRMALKGKNGNMQWYWVQNKVRESAATFAYVYYNGNAACYNVSLSMGVRPAFKIRSTVAKNQRITHSD